jgi:hypothetical protein
MILDNFLMFTGTSNGATAGITNSALGDRPTTGAQVSSNIVDLHMTGVPVLAANQGARDIGVGEKLKMLVQVLTTFGAGTSMIIALAGAPDSGTGTPGTFVPWWLSPTYLAATPSLGLDSRHGQRAEAACWRRILGSRRCSSPLPAPSPLAR